MLPLARPGGHHSTAAAAAAARCYASTSAPRLAPPPLTSVNESTDSQDALVSRLVAQGVVRSARVEGVLRAMDRQDFTSTHMGIPIHVSYADSQVPIGRGASISAPSLHAMCLELLAEHAVPGARVLDVGAGSCYLSGCLALLVGGEGRVVALERQERLLEQGAWMLARALSAHRPHLTPAADTQPAPQRPGPTPDVRRIRLCNVDLLHGNALEEHVLAAAGGPFDAIHVGAAAREVPAVLAALLRPGGRMVLPIGPPAGMQSLTVVDKGPDGALATSPVRDVKLPPLVPPHAERPLGFAPGA